MPFSPLGGLIKKNPLALISPGLALAFGGKKNKPTPAPAVPQTLGGM